MGGKTEPAVGGVGEPGGGGGKMKTDASGEDMGGRGFAAPVVNLRK